MTRPLESDMQLDPVDESERGLTVDEAYALLAGVDARTSETPLPPTGAASNAETAT